MKKILPTIIHIPKNTVIFLINFYQKNFSFDHSLKLLKLREINPRYQYKGCKYYPSCSEYTKQSITKYGLIIGGLIGFWRILRCNPFSHGGHDPIPELKKTKN